MTTIQTGLFSGDELDQILDQSVDPTSAQWHLSAMQVVNWGGFEGCNDLPFHPNATLVSGGSGTGKSTLLDAYTALMMPSSVAFNGASNTSGTGRARSEAGGQRTLLTYLRGKQGVNDESGGATSDHLLRGKGVPTWGAIGATFTDTTGRVFSAMRVYFVPVSATDAGGVTERMVTRSGPADLADLDRLMSSFTAGKRLADVISGTWPGAKITGTYTEFANTLFTQLGIGANGDGAKALDLLARIQAGRSVNSVNALFRDLVLDEPTTFKFADRALAHFDVIADDLARMEEAERKHTTLSPIRNVHEQLVTARARVAELDQYGLSSRGFSKMTAWSIRRESDLLDAAVDLTQARRATASEKAAASAALVGKLRGELRAAQADYRKSGGDELAGLEGRIEVLEGELAEATASRDQLDTLADQVSMPLNSRGDFDALQEAADRFITGRPEWMRQQEDRRDGLRDRLVPLRRREKEIVADLLQLEQSGTRIKATLGQLRTQIAQAIGMDPGDLPYLAELIDLRPGQERWRTAVETVLGGDASRLVIPRARRREIARILDQLHVSRQVRLIDADPDLPLRASLDGDDTPEHQGRILGKLQFVDHPYTGWVQRHLAGPGLNAWCVERPDDLDADSNGAGGAGGLRVTAAGQTRNGVRSSIGRSSRDDIIGFSNAGDVARLTDELTATRGELAAVLHQMTQVGEETSERALQHDAHHSIQRFRWVDVDVAAAQTAVEDARQRQSDILGSNDVVRQLGELVELLEQQVNDALEAKVKDEAAQTTLDKLWDSLTVSKDALSNQLAPHEFDDAYALSPTQQQDLDEAYADAVAGADGEDAVLEASRFGERTGVMHRLLADKLKAATNVVVERENDLTRTFRQYQRDWPDANRGVALESYLDYKAILDDLDATGLHLARENWQRTVTQWSAQDLMDLKGALSGDVDIIKSRVAPINDILATLPFGARQGRLRLKVDTLSSETVRQFRRRLIDVTSWADKVVTFDDTKRAFENLAGFMDQLRAPGDRLFNPDRSNRQPLLDVRRHVEVYAVEYPVGSDTWPATEHRQIGSASGGESQELIAFILGSALRFRLGDELRDRPRFSPVFLDEGFVKADSQFAGRAVSAWRGLGFQIIVGSPEDKFTGLERYMDEFIVITKDPSTGFSQIDRMTDAALHDARGSQAGEDAGEDAAEDAVTGSAVPAGASGPTGLGHDGELHG